jgi:hypothetical protein
MADYLTLPEVKKHLHCEDFDDDDDYITILMNVVEAAVASEIGEDLADLDDEADGFPVNLLHAMFLLVGHFYMIREPVTMGVSTVEVPFAFKFLYYPFKNWTVR